MLNDFQACLPQFSLLAIYLIFFTWSIALVSGTTISLNSTAVAHYGFCLRKEPMIRRPLVVLECQAAIDIFNSEKPDASYRLTHDATEDPDEILCPYMRSQGDCAVIIDYNPNKQRPVEITALLSWTMQELLFACVEKDPVDDGGMMVFDETTTWVWVGHVPYANTSILRTKISQQTSDVVDLTSSTS